MGIPTNPKVSSMNKKPPKLHYTITYLLLHTQNIGCVCEALMPRMIKLRGKNLGMESAMAKVISFCGQAIRHRTDQKLCLLNLRLQGGDQKFPQNFECQMHRFYQKLRIDANLHCDKRQ